MTTEKLRFNSFLDKLVERKILTKEEARKMKRYESFDTRRNSNEEKD